MYDYNLKFNIIIFFVFGFMLFDGLVLVKIINDNMLLFFNCGRLISGLFLSFFLD